MGQLNLAGGEDPPAYVAARGSGLTPTQREILRLAMRPCGVTASEAGRIIHTHRNNGAGCRPGRAGAAGVAVGGQPAPGRPCCPWMTGDGSDAIKRLRERGLVTQRKPRGPWYGSPPPGDA